MAIQLNAQRIRFACDASKPFAAANDAITNAALALPSGSALQLEVLFYFGQLADPSLLDLSVYSQIVVQLQDNSDPHAGTVYYNGSVASGNFQASTTAQWQAGTNQHLVLQIPSAQNVVPPAATNYWIVIYGVSTDPAADLVLLFAANIQGKDSGVPQMAAVLPAGYKAGNKLSFLCADALTRDVTLVNMANGRWNLDISQVGYNGVGQNKYSVYCSDGQWRDLTVVLAQGVWTLDINQNGHA